MHFIIVYDILIVLVIANSVIIISYTAMVDSAISILYTAIADSTIVYHI